MYSMNRLHNDNLMDRRGSTVKAVAKLAGVSTGTVSRVLNNHPKVSRENKEAVERAISELNYRPDPVARSMRKMESPGRIWTGNVGVVFPNTTTAMLKLPFMAQMIQGVQSELADNGYHLLISNTTDPVSLPDIVRDGKVEGVLFHGDVKAEWCNQINYALPAVSMGLNHIGLPISMVNVNNRAAIISAVQYLAELGHRRIGFMAREPEQLDLAERLLGYREAFGWIGMAYDPSLESVAPPQGSQGPRTPETEPPGMDDLLEPLLRLPQPPTAIIIPSDWQTIGVYRALQARGLRIPQDISLIGFDNNEQICHSLSPGLTSLEYPAEQIGRQAVQLLLKQFKLNTRSLQEMVLIKSRLVERKSCVGRK
jgi:LacI family transcriptional regulator, repressor for deo operon, udp, cdd, tsx, nupC, and nupG